ncbi:proline--tRNA ligase [Frondihabitans australicus]|uniref:Proline--tRNA ligase n=1 Tax=Frondihabitans australicus TaxID=386892 RepID=A0A495IEV4_9MICO|nr:proline--tRNA ligase [Frondihabitans australicus]RKR73881.1 prolyl-tRNA synthetase [Frondihabitans australicus]
MATQNRAPVLTPQAEDFPRWYQDVLEKAEMADNGPVRGTMVIRPYAYGLWENMQREVDSRIKATGAENVYLPLFIPQSYLEREAEHVEGFSPELAVVTHAGGKELGEPVVVRPTSETVFGEMMAKWVQSHRDLPMRLNQWANVVRWELRPRLFLRTTEFLWQEGHTAHATEADASAYARTIHLDVYRDFLQNALAIPVLTGLKTPRERFAGAVTTMTCEAMMGDGKALQMATSHELGQNFARAFDIGFTDETGQVQTCWTTSWGSSTRMVGGLIMAHGDDQGLRIPPRVAPIQAAVIAVKDDPRTLQVAADLVAELERFGVRARLDDRTSQGFGRRATEWELKGVPLRVEVGPRDLEAGRVTVARRDSGEKTQEPLDTFAEEAPALLSRMHAALIDSSRARLAERTHDVATSEEAFEAAQTGFGRIAWSTLGEDGEADLNRRGVTVRCLQLPDGSLPEPQTPGDDLVAIVARAY